MPILHTKIVHLRPVIAETGPIGTGTRIPTPTPPPTPPPSTSVFALKHSNFIDQVEALNRGFEQKDINGFTPDELNEHVTVALQDNYITEDGYKSGRYVSGQVAWRLKELTKGYVYERL